MKELAIKQIPYEAKQTILAAVFTRMDKNAKLFQNTYGTTYENIKSDSYLLECFIEDLQRCCLYTRTLNDMIADYDENGDGDIDEIKAIQATGITGQALYDAIHDYWITDTVIVVVTDDDDVDWCIAFLD